MLGCLAVQLRVRVTIKMKNDRGDICAGGPHIRHHGSFTLKVMNRGFFSRPCGGVVCHANVFYHIPLLQGTEVMVRMLPLFFYCFQVSFFHLIPLYFKAIDSCSNLTDSQGQQMSRWTHKFLSSNWPWITAYISYIQVWLRSAVSCTGTFTPVAHMTFSLVYSQEEDFSALACP